jgi:hypothetical protein
VKVKSVLAAVRRIRTATIKVDIVDQVNRWDGAKSSYYQWTVRNHGRAVVLKQRPEDIDNCDAFIPPLRPSESWEHSDWTLVRKICDVVRHLA